MHEIPHVNWLSSTSSVILLQIVMVCPGTHPVRNDESLYTTNDSWGLHVTRIIPLIVNLETDAKTLYYSLLKLKYCPSMYLKQKKLD